MYNEICFDTDFLIGANVFYLQLSARSTFTGCCTTVILKERPACLQAGVTEESYFSAF
jgi:hypothetical protein